MDLIFLDNSFNQTFWLKIAGANNIAGITGYPDCGK